MSKISFALLDYKFIIPMNKFFHYASIFKFFNILLACNFFIPINKFVHYRFILKFLNTKGIMLENFQFTESQ